MIDSEHTLYHISFIWRAPLPSSADIIVLPYVYPAFADIPVSALPHSSTHMWRFSSDRYEVQENFSTRPNLFIFIMGYDNPVLLVRLTQWEFQMR